jgi:hypothetical protein
MARPAAAEFVLGSLERAREGGLCVGIDRERRPPGNAAFRRGRRDEIQLHDRDCLSVKKRLRFVLPLGKFAEWTR